MATLDYDYSFQNNTTANALEVMGNFNKAKSFAETKVVQIDGSVKADTAAITDSAITTAKIADLNVTTGKIAESAVTQSKIADGSITVAKLAAGVQMSGPTGATGPQGPQGIQGPTGPQGPQGATGPESGTASVLSSGAGTFSQVGSWWNVTGEVDFQGPIYYINVGPSSATEGIVRISTGELKKNSASGVSFRDYKEDIVEMENGLEQLCLLKPRNFRFKEEVLVPNEPYDVFNRRTQLQYGFVMEEVQDAIPDLVMHKSPDGIEHTATYWKESGVIALAVAAIQELSAKVDALQAEVDSLKNG